MTSGIYLWTVTRPGNVPLVYTGQAQDLIDRRRRYVEEWTRPRKKYTTNRRLRHAVRYYGAAAVSYQVLEVVEDLGQLAAREDFWWSHFMELERQGQVEVATRVRPGENPMRDPEVRERHAASAVEAGKKRAASPEFQAALASRGEEWRERKRAASVAACAKPYTFVTPNGETVEVYNLNQFCADNGLNTPKMCEVASGKRAHHKGWRRVDG